MGAQLDKLLETLRCPSCRDVLSGSREDQPCGPCAVSYGIAGGIPRMLSPALRDALAGHASLQGRDAKSVETALSFGFEWQHFSDMYAKSERHFLDYMRPHAAVFFRGKKVLDAGCGNGR